MNTLIELFIKTIPYINIIIGTVLILTGFKIYKPFVKEKEETVHKKYGDLFKYGGIIMVIGGLIGAFA